MTHSISAVSKWQPRGERETRRRLRKKYHVILTIIRRNLKEIHPTNNIQHKKK